MDFIPILTTYIIKEIKMEREAPYKITKSNALIEACYSLSLEEERLLLAALIQVDSRTKFPDKITIDAQYFADLFNLDMKTSYRHLEAGCELYEQDFVVKDYNNGSPRICHHRWLQKVWPHEDERKVDLYFSEGIKPYLSNLQGEFTSYHPMYITELNSSYAIRIYELLVQYKQLNMQRVMSVNDLKEKLNLGTQYPMFADFSEQILQPAVESINATSDILVTWEPVKIGNTIERVKFNYKLKRILTLD